MVNEAEGESFFKLAARECRQSKNKGRREPPLGLLET